MSDRKRNRLAVALALATLAGWGCAALAQQGPVGQGLDNAGRAMKRGFQTAGQAVQGSFVKARTSVHSMEVVSRIYSRLHWEKALTTSNLEIEVRDGGIATVTGVVPDAPAKAKALNLTAETVGVAQVVDQITVTPPGSTAAPIVPGNAPIVVPSGSTVIVPGNAPIIVPAPARSRGDVPL